MHPRISEMLARGARCDLCPLREQVEKGETKIVSETPAKSSLKLIIVGEAPGRSEEKLGQAFVGLSGQFVESRLREIGVRRGDVHLTNAAFCRGDSDDENELAAECCAPRLLKELAALPAGVPIMTLGKLATKTVTGNKSILKARGFIWTAKEIPEGRIRAARKTAKGPRGVLVAETLEGRAKIAGRIVLPSIHPAFVLRSPTWKPVSQVDFKRAKRVIENGLAAIEDAKDAIVGGPGKLCKLDKRKPIAVDIETDGIKPLECNILCIGLSDGDRTVVIWPWHDGLSHALTKFLRACTAGVVMHNGYNFDQLVMRAKGIDFSGVKLEDTLLAHHVYASHLPQRLAQVVSEYVDSSPWKINFGKKGEEEKGLPPNELSAEDLIKYNAIDAKHTALCWNRMQDDLAPERVVYEHDKQLAAICRDAIEAGIGIDHQRRELLLRLAKNRRAALKGRIRSLIGRPAFNPGKLDSVRSILFGSLKVRALSLTKKGLPSTSNLTLESVRNGETRAAQFADLLLKWREVGKISSTYVETVEVNPRTKRMHWNLKPFGTVSGRLSGRLQSCPRVAPDADGKIQITARPRELYIPAKGNVFVYFDVSQAEMRLAAYLSGDPAFIAACEGDIHANNAKVIFPEIAAKGWLDGDAKKDPARGKPYRDITKNFGFAISYYADAPAVFAYLHANGFPVPLQVVEVMLMRLHSTYKVYFRYVERNWEIVRKTGCMRTPILGRIRWMGWFPKITEVANYPVQAALADIMNARMIEAAKVLPGRVKLVAQIHDACIYDTPRHLENRVKKIIANIWEKPIVLAGGALVLPIDLKTGTRWSEL